MLKVQTVICVYVNLPDYYFMDFSLEHSQYFPGSSNRYIKNNNDDTYNNNDDNTAITIEVLLLKLIKFVILRKWENESTGTRTQMAPEAPSKELSWGLTWDSPSAQPTTNQHVMW